MDLSIIIPLLNESESLDELHDWILNELKTVSIKYEIIFIDDGSIDNSWEKIQILNKRNKNTKGIRFLKNYGKSQALHAGFLKCSGRIVVTLDADLQDSPSEILNLYNRIINEKLDVISGWKKKRYDSIIFKNIPSKIFNWAARKVSGIKIHDFNCGIKAYRSEVIKNINVYGEMHRYIPVLASNNGYNKIDEQIVIHQARKYGVTKFGWSRFINGFLDLITIWFLNKFGKKPMHLFGLIGTIMLIIGFFSSLYIGIDKLYFKTEGRLITERPEFYIALTTMILGAQFFVAGFVGELIIKYQNKAKRYRIISTLFNKK